MTPKEVATWLNMSLVWVYKQAEKGLLPFHRVGDAIRFDPEEIRAYLDERKSVRKTYGRCRNPKRRSRETSLIRNQEVEKSGCNVKNL